MSDLRALVRELLSEEIAVLRAEVLGQLQAERVLVGNEVELTDFALRVARRAQEPGFLAALEAGRIRFAPAAQQAVSISPSALPERKTRPSPIPPTALAATIPVPVPELRKNLVTERDIAAIAQGETRLRITKTARLTPLASDEVRRRRLRIERTLV